MQTAISIAARTLGISVSAFQSLCRDLGLGECSAKRGFPEEALQPVFEAACRRGLSQEGTVKDKLGHALLVRSNVGGWDGLLARTELGRSEQEQESNYAHFRVGSDIMVAPKAYAPNKSLLLAYRDVNPLARNPRTAFEPLTGLTQEGSTVRGTVMKLSTQGAELALLPASLGLPLVWVPFDEVSWYPMLAHEIAAPDATLEVTLIHIDPEIGTVVGSIRRSATDPRAIVESFFPYASEHQVEIVRQIHLSKLGVQAYLVKLMEFPDIFGMIDFGEISWNPFDTKGVDTEKPVRAFSLGDCSTDSDWGPLIRLSLKRVEGNPYLAAKHMKALNSSIRVVICGESPTTGPVRGYFGVEEESQCPVFLPQVNVEGPLGEEVLESQSAVNAIIVGFDDENERLIVAARGTGSDALKKFLSIYPEKSIARGLRVVHARTAGVTVDVEGTEVHIPAEELSWESNCVLPEPGSRLDVRVLVVDAEEGLLLSPKRVLTPNQYFLKKHPPGTEVTAHVIKNPDRLAEMLLARTNLAARFRPVRGEVIEANLDGLQLEFADGRRGLIPRTVLGETLRDYQAACGKLMRQRSVQVVPLGLNDRTVAFQPIERALFHQTASSAWVELENGILGRVARGELTWYPDVDPGSVVSSLGPSVMVRVVEESKKGWIETSLRQTCADPWPEFRSSVHIGAEVEGIPCEYVELEIGSQDKPKVIRSILVELDCGFLGEVTTPLFAWELNDEEIPGAIAMARPFARFRAGAKFIKRYKLNTSHPLAVKQAFEVLDVTDQRRRIVLSRMHAVYRPLLDSPDPIRATVVRVDDWGGYEAVTDDGQEILVPSLRASWIREPSPSVGSKVDLVVQEIDGRRRALIGNARVLTPPPVGRFLDGEVEEGEPAACAAGVGTITTGDGSAAKIYWDACRFGDFELDTLDLRRSSYHLNLRVLPGSEPGNMRFAFDMPTDFYRQTRYATNTNTAQLLRALRRYNPDVLFEYCLRWVRQGLADKVRAVLALIREGVCNPEKKNRLEETLQLLSGEILAARFVKRDRIRGGTFGDIFDGYDLKTGKRVAIKEFVEKEDESLRRQYEAEAEILKRYGNSFVVRYVGADLAENYFVLEFLEGETFGDRIQRLRAASAEKRMSELMPPLCNAAKGLAALHARGIFHLDLKPDNLFITADGGGKLIDFGSAAILRPDGSYEVEGGEGTPGYRSPEQCQSYNCPEEDVQFTDKSDVYSFACILYEIVSGRPVYQSEDESELDYLHRYGRMDEEGGQYVPVECLVDEVPSIIARLLDSCLQFDPERRPPMKHVVGQLMKYSEIQGFTVR
jgi:ribosomal protein S1